MHHINLSEGGTLGKHSRYNYTTSTEHKTNNTSTFYNRPLEEKKQKVSLRVEQVTCSIV